MQRIGFLQENCPTARTLGLVGRPIAEPKLMSDDGRWLSRNEIGMAAVPRRADPA